MNVSLQLLDDGRAADFQVLRGLTQPALARGVGAFRTSAVDICCANC